ncbi:uncharacterized protein J3D65DRAFT_628842 [Phyllosticta citribraziliensis]|uniref:Transmembrane protein n=1 Tax=Phyllosticta citribraziliensis TaxID=989973 RepID=A0ABR1LJL7_9PEZI
MSNQRGAGFQPTQEFRKPSIPQKRRITEFSLTGSFSFTACVFWRPGARAVLHTSDSTSRLTCSTAPHRRRLALFSTRVCGVCFGCYGTVVVLDSCGNRIESSDVALPFAPFASSHLVVVAAAVAVASRLAFYSLIHGKLLLS